MLRFSDLATAAYCPRQLYYRRGDDVDPPSIVADRRAIAFRYPDLLTTDEETIGELPIEVDPATFSQRLQDLRDRLSRRCWTAEPTGEPADGKRNRSGTARDRPDTDPPDADTDLWSALVDPVATEVLLTGRECRGIAHKLIDPGVPAPVLISPGSPPEQGVWQPQSVRAVAAMKAFAYEIERPVRRAIVEYPAHAVVRTVRSTSGSRAAYRRAVEAVERLNADGDPPPRIDDRSKCGPCDYRSECGVRTRSLRSLLGL